MNTNLTLGSLFDGSGGFPLGGLLSGVTPVWASEIEPFPIRVTTKRLPNMKHYGDISAMDGGRIEPVDIICFGSPCTDMSIAGLRAGLDGRQSSLFYQAIRIIKEMRCATNGKFPRWICWENVPGAFSSNAGRDFKAVLEAIIGIAEPETQVPMPEKNKWPYADCYMGDRWSVAYRTLDAQHWGVPQRRRRIYLVADLTGQCAGKVLFESEGLSRYSAEGFRTWKKITNGTTGSIGTSGLCLNDQGGKRMDFSLNVAGTLRAEAHHPPVVLERNVYPVDNHPTDCRVCLSSADTVQTLTARMGTGGNNVPLIMKIRSGCDGGGKGPLIQTNKSATLSCNNDQTLFVPKAYGICSKDSNAMKSSNPDSGFYEATTTRTLDANGGNPSCNQGGMAIVENKTFSSSKASFFTEVYEEIAATLCATDYKDPPLVNGMPQFCVRRLTPTECARLQGFPDWWCSNLGTDAPTDDEVAFWTEVWETHRRIVNPAAKPRSRNQILKWIKNPHSDSAEYKMWGNGVALPCVVFVLSGIVFYAQSDEI